ncbi:peptidase S8/S53 domain-containing protein [Panaeolus papilionaceus]|nr:peptidase S8/S53 domain-containing protein [Panaeolus papilionaceus]
MRFSIAYPTLAIPVIPSPATPSSLVHIQTFKGETSGKYIVKFKPGVYHNGPIKKFNLLKHTELDIFNGVAGQFDADTLNALRASPDVECVHEGGIVHTVVTINYALTYTCNYDESAGEGVDIYIVDTGVYISHSQFSGRTRWGLSIESYGQTDGNGHDTHCAGTAAGSQYGVPKVLSDVGSGSISGIVTGLSWVKSQAQASGRPSIVSMSLGGGASTPLDDAVASLTAAGVPVDVATGNSNTNAANTSPAPSAVTVGATTIADARASFSNYGAVVDDFWNFYGTAIPHIAGLLAYPISKEGNLSPASLEAKVKAYSMQGTISGIRESFVSNLKTIVVFQGAQKDNGNLVLALFGI